MRLKTVPVVLSLIAAVACASPASATEWFVAPNGIGPGTSTAPFGRIQDALNAAQPGDTITVLAGEYVETLHTVRGGTSALPIRLRAEGPRGSVVVTALGRVLRVDHPFVIIEGLVLDGQYGFDDTVRVYDGAQSLILRNVEVRRSSLDLIDMGSPQGVLIEDCLIHHALNATGGRTDAHGIVALAVRDLTIRNTEIHTFSGDGIQIDPARLAQGWTRVTIEGSRIWLAPLPAPENGFAAGTVPGENAVDTKANSSATRATMLIRDTTASGFGGGLIGNMAAFNLKENVDVTVDRVTVHDSEIAFRLRGPTSTTAKGAWVTIKNAVIHSTMTAFRYENDIEQLRIWNSTLGAGITQAFQAASSTSNGIEVRNLLVLGPLPSLAQDGSNLAVSADAFVSATTHNYELALGSPAIDRGTTLSDVRTDRAGVARPQGPAYDIGAYERQSQVAEAHELVVHAWRAPIAAGAWQLVNDASAAGGMALRHRDERQATVPAPLANPLNFFEIVVPVEAGRPYRLWIRGRAQKDSPRNDSVYVQFSGAVDASGQNVYGIGTTSAAIVNIEECDGCGLSRWGWQDNGSDVGVLGPEIRFGRTGVQTIRIQTREDGLEIDQIVLSPGTYLNAPPGAAKRDQTILPES